MSSKRQIFARMYDSPKVRAIPFVIEWSNGSGYFDNAIYGEHAVTVKNGELLRSVSPGGRRLLFLGTRLGALVVFDRYGDEAASGVFSYNTTTAVERGRWIQNRALTVEDMAAIFGWNADDGTLASVIDDVYSGCKKSAQGV